MVPYEMHITQLFYQQHVQPGTERCQLTSLSTKEEGEPDGELFLWAVKHLM